MHNVVRYHKSVPLQMDTRCAASEACSQKNQYSAPFHARDFGFPFRNLLFPPKKNLFNFISKKCLPQRAMKEDGAPP